MAAHSLHHHAQQPSYVSDYSDNQQAPLLDTLPPAPTSRTNADLNLAVLRRHLPLIESVRFVANYAVIYIWSLVTEEWEKCGIEGTLFIVQLNSTNGARGERHAVVLLNRMGLNTFAVELKRRDDVQLDGEFIIIQGTAGLEGSEGMNGGEEEKIFGIWIFQEETSTAGMRDRTSEEIIQCATEAENGLEDDLDGNVYENGNGIVLEGNQGLEYTQEPFNPHHQQPQSNGFQHHHPSGAVSPNLMALLNGPTHPTPMAQLSAVASPPTQHRAGEQRDILDLFRKAGENFQY